MNQQWVKLLLIGIALALAIVLIYVVVHDLWSHNFLVRTIDYVVSNLANRSGLSVFLVKGLVIIITIPFFWAVAHYTHGLLWHRHLGPSLRLYRNPYGLIIVGYAGLFFIAMYFASREAYAYKWCAETPEGIRTFDAAGKDPVYGIEAKPCSFEQIVDIRETDKRVLGPQKIQIGDVKQFAFFDAITGKPRVWYYRLANDSYEFYDRPGKHPGTGDDLRPIDQETRDELIRLQDLRAARVQQQELQTKEQAAAKATAENQRQHLTLVERYINTTIQKHPGRAQAGVLVLGEPQNQLSSIADSIAAALAKRGIEPTTSFFKQPFIAEGRARRLLDGDWDDVRQLELSNRIDYAVLASSAVRFTASQQVDGVITADLRVDLRCFNVSSQKVCGSGHVEIPGAGFSNGAALDNAVSKAGPQIESAAQAMQFR